MESKVNERQDVTPESPGSGRNMNALIGLLLIVMGGLFLAGQLLTVSNLIWSMLLVAAGVGLGLVYVMRRDAWWVLIPAYILTLAGVFLSVERYLPGDWDAVYWVAAIGAPFLFTFLTNPRERWWAAIPAYVFAVVALFLGVERYLPGDWEAIYFVGALGVPFLIVFATSPRQRWWALIPGGLFAAVGAFLLLEETSLSGAMDLAAVYWLGFFATAFGVVFATAPRKRWWALIPMYVFLTALFFVLFERPLERADLTPAYWMMAVALPFFVVYITNTSRWWALIPGGIFAVSAVGYLIAEIEVFFPVVLILAGLVVLARTLLRGSGGETERDTPLTGPEADV